MDKLVWKVKGFNELSAAELYKILQARTRVFIIEQDCHYLDQDDYDQKALHLWAESGGEILAYCRIFDRGIKYQEASIGRVLSTEKARGKGVGRQLVAFALQIIENRFGNPKIRISAQDYLLKFYADFGFRDTSKKYFEDEIPHTEMIRD